MKKIMYLDSKVYFVIVLTVCDVCKWFSNIPMYWMKLTFIN